MVAQNREKQNGVDVKRNSKQKKSSKRSDSDVKIKNNRSKISKNDKNNSNKSYNNEKKNKTVSKVNDGHNAKKITKKNVSLEKKPNILQSLFVNKLRFSFFDLLLFTVVVVVVSMVGMTFIMQKYYKENSLFYGTSLSSDEYLGEFIQTYSDVIENYYEEVDKKGLVEAAMSGMMSYLEDNYSIFLDKDASQDLNTSLSGTYQGIGIVASGRVIVDVYKDSPAERAGLQINDEIVKINGTVITDENYLEITNLLYTDSDKENSIVVKREGKEQSFSLSTDTVIINTVTTKVIEKDKKNIGYISLTTFSSKSHEQFEEGLLSVEEKGIDSLIIDLRGNSGGYLNVANHIGSMFLKKGELLYSLESKGEVTDFKDKTDEKREYPIVVLVNGSTASAAEILTTALKDSYDATIVGTKTYGKGKVQTIAQYEDSAVKYTSARWLRPNGECIDSVGIKPDYEVINEMKNYIIYDKQMDKAIDLLK